MKHSRGLKVNHFPPPSSLRSEGAFQGYQLGSVAGMKVIGVWGEESGVNELNLPQQKPLHQAGCCLQWCPARQQHDFGVEVLYLWAAPQQLPERLHTQIHGYRSTEG